MQSQTALNGRRALGQVAHVSVHLLVHEPERQSLVSDKSLIVAFTITDALFRVATVGQSVANGIEVPLIVGRFLQ